MKEDYGKSRIGLCIIFEFAPLISIIENKIAN